MRLGVIFGSALFASCLFPLAHGSDAVLRDCRISIAMSDGTALPSGLRLSLFDHERRVYQGKVSKQGVVEIPQMKPGDYRMQIGSASPDFLTSGPFHVDSIRPCSTGLNLDGRTDSARKLVEDNVGVEDLRLPDRVRAMYQAAFCDFQQGELEKARQRFLRVAALAPRLSRVYNVLGVIATQQEKPADAEMYFNQALELDPRSKSALMNLAKLSLTEKQYQAALELAQRYQDGSRDIADVHAIKAEVYLRTGRLKEAVRETEAVHALPHANWAGVHLIAARALEVLNRQDAALREYQVYVAEARDDQNRRWAVEKINQLTRTVPPSSLPQNSLLAKGVN